MKHKKKQEIPEEYVQLNQAVGELDAKRAQPQKPDRATRRAEKRAADIRKKADAKLKKSAKKLVVPQTVQDTIPYKRTYPNSGIIETSDGIFSKSYLLEDVNYQTAKDEEQTNMFLAFAELHNSFDSSSNFEFTIVQQNRNLAEFEASARLQLKDDDLDLLRMEQNEINKNMIRQGKNELIKHKYLTVSQAYDSYDAANAAFLRLDTQIKSSISRIGGAFSEAMSTAKRLEAIHDIYNPDAVGLFGNNYEMRDGRISLAQDNFSFDILRKMGVSTKDMVAPSSFEFKSDHGKCGDYYFRAMFISQLPATLKDTFLMDLTEVPCRMVVSVHYKPIEAEVSQTMVKNDITNMNSALVKAQRTASANGYSVDLINPELRMEIEEANALLEDISTKNQKLFYQTFLVVHFADTKEQLDLDTKSLQATARKHLVELHTLMYQQELGLNSCLPLARNYLSVRRTLISESAAVFMPFVNQELNDRSGMIYGLNAVSHNLIMFNRRTGKNGNGMIFGAPGSGKSMAAKNEMKDVLLSSNDDVIVVDPQGEYARLAKMLGGEVIVIDSASGMHINPFDIEMSDDNPIVQKSDFIYSFFETIMGERIGLSPAQKSILDRCVTKIYEPFLESYRDGSYDKEKLPTLVDFYFLLRQQDSYEAMQLADALEIYAVGSQSIFAAHTNVDPKNRFVVYDISKIGSGLKSLGLLVVTNSIWTRLMQGFTAGRNVWVYIDEAHLLFANNASAVFLKSFYKQARKYGGLPTGITQNITDLLENDIARAIIQNCEFVQMLSMSAIDRAQLAELLNISPSQMDYITDKEAGHGLIFDGKHIVPFVNDIPRNTRIYKAMTTKPTEVKQIEEAEAEKEKVTESSNA